MYTIGSLVFFVIMSFSTYATEQAPDRLIVDDDTLLLHALPLEEWRNQNNRETPLFLDSVSSFSTGCWRGYIAYWELIDNRLYLSSIYIGDHATVNLEDLFAETAQDGRVYADWFSDTVTAYQGELLYSMHMGFSSIYEYEFEYVFDRGVLMHTAYFDNSLSKNGPLFINQANLRPVIDSLIDWVNLPPIEESIRVIIHVEGNEQGRVDSVLEVRGKSDIFKEEALRVTHLLTQLPVIYSRGKFLRKPVALPFAFTRAKQQQRKQSENTSSR